jgi:uncharacterized membrane protein
MRKAAWITMTGLALSTALGALRYFSLNPVVFIPGQKVAYLANLGPLLLHISGGTLAIVIGPFQLLTGLRGRHRGLHRLLGRLYLAGVLATAAGGLLLARIAMGGPLGRLGFATLALVLLATTAAAFASILRGRVAAHRAWMIRSYAVVFTAVTFRVWLGALTPWGLPFDQVYAVGAWTAWMINLLAAETLLGMDRARRRRSAPAGTATQAALSQAVVYK